jgi:hypothetical protein
MPTDRPSRRMQNCYRSVLRTRRAVLRWRVLMRCAEVVRTREDARAARGERRRRYQVKIGASIGWK